MADCQWALTLDKHDANDVLSVSDGESQRCRVTRSGKLDRRAEPEEGGGRRTWMSLC
jgi:hypothetical protein